MKGDATNVEPVDTGAPKTEFSSKIAKERQELYSLFSVSGSFSASSGLSSAKASMSALNEVNFDSESVVWLLSARSDFGRMQMKTVELRDNYSGLSSSAVVALCGSHFIVMERREAVVSAVFSFKTSSRRTREEISAALSGSWSGGNFSTNVSNQLKKALATTQVTFTFIAKGGDGLSATSGFVTSFDNIDEIRKQVATYIAGMTREKAPAAEYFPARLPLIEGNQPGIPDRRERALSELWIDFVRHDDLLREARAKKDNLAQYWYIDQTVLDNFLTAIIASAKSRIDQIQIAVDQCKSDKDRCSSLEEKSTRVAWPSIEPVTKAQGYTCGPRCNSIAEFLLLIEGPGTPASIKYDKIQLGFTDSPNLGYNCGRNNAVTPDGYLVRCDIGYDKVQKEAINLVIRDQLTNRVAYKAPVLDLAPDLFP